MKRFLLLVVIAVSLQAQAQQIVQYSQYLNNKYIYNPAAAGVLGKLNLDFGYRNQWAGFENAPTSYFVSGQYVLGEENRRRFYTDHSIRVSNPDLFKYPDTTAYYRHVVGAYHISNNFFPTQTRSTFLSYAYHFPVDEFQISVGAAVGMKSLEFNEGVIEMQEENDDFYNDVIGDGTNSNYLDIDVGVLAYSSNMFFGYSIKSLGADAMNLSKSAVSPDLNMHHYLSFGTKLEVKDVMYVQPGVMIRAAKETKTSMDINATVYYKKIVFAGVSFRPGEAIIGMFGLYFNNHYKISYSYDAGISNLRTTNGGSHEVMLGVRL